ncbi:16S rRNA (guanine(966)-N(2))-methyltransferase RsmD [Paenibacillus sp. Root52]|uniref:16S rRNA (Guanine(966)-N(2))-methyltransferase RsmD n=1 Tax=Paenibacillus amylolyticus TaxID=1451 RepID=A0AAP5GXF5_PAEAM|nr:MULTISPECIES: 16S rRNA (guanine(966)-N(2))-methyltransferase RsmD [Paenibacillus]KQY83069.1 16S rRNA (guanine(966)-N(2))-methyltransferase RsmD [Paenibacillus sp. Root52]MDR6722378.1 16S rRNA (guanine(966)-N(2))-methyltransferase RsmD [Paenibacillus amylolyticus]
MRVVSGSAKGRPLKAVPGTGTRPTTDKVKEALFSMIGPYFEGGTALDLFAGSGGLGIEALSRGMDKAIFVDLEPKSIEVIRMNLTATKLENQAAIYRNDAGRALKALAKRSTTFDLVFLDPPYRMKNGNELMLTMHELELLEHGATIVLEYESKHLYPEQFGPFEQTRKALYGETAVSIYHYAPHASEDGESSTAEEEDLHE